MSSWRVLGHPHSPIAPDWRELRHERGEFARGSAWERDWVFGVPEIERAAEVMR